MISGRTVRRALSRSSATLIAVVCALASALVVASCQSESTPPTSTSTSTSTTTTVPVATRLCDGGAPTQIGTLQDPQLNELSGLAASRQHADVLWAHNDSGDSARIFAIDTTGAPRATVDLDTRPATDWEDIAIDGETLYVGDIGDNQRARTAIYVHRLAEPALTATSAAADTFELHYPDGPHDAEALMVDSVGDELVVVTKEAGGNSRVYTTPLSAPGALQPGASLALGVGRLVTAGDISADGDVIVLRTYTEVFVWTRNPGEALAAAFGRAPCAAPAPADAQGEALALLPAGDGYITSSERVGSPIWQVLGGSATP